MKFILLLLRTRMGKYMSNNNNYFTPEDDDEDYGFIDFEDDNYDGNDDEYYDSDDEYADSYNDSDDDYSINRNYNKYDSKASNQKIIHRDL